VKRRADAAEERTVLKITELGGFQTRGSLRPPDVVLLEAKAGVKGKVLVRSLQPHAVGRIPPGRNVIQNRSDLIAVLVGLLLLDLGVVFFLFVFFFEIISDQLLDG